MSPTPGPGLVRTHPWAFCSGLHFTFIVHICVLPHTALSQRVWCAKCLLAPGVALFPSCVTASPCKKEANSEYIIEFKTHVRVLGSFFVSLREEGQNIRECTGCLRVGKLYTQELVLFLRVKLMLVVSWVALKFQKNEEIQQVLGVFFPPTVERVLGFT